MEIKVMTFNLRYDCEGDGINSFTNRFNRVLETIKNQNADIIGFQEVIDSMRTRVRNSLDGYTTVGCGRDRNYHGEAMLIAFRTDVFELIRVENIWLSKTPEIPGSRYEDSDQSGCPRMYTKIILKHNDIAEPFYFINTHLDHAGKEARYIEADQLTDDILSLDRKYIITGDFNAIPTDPEIELIKSKISKNGGVDATADIGPTFHDFGRLPEDKAVKIDYIFTNAECKNVYRVDDIPVNGQYYSDHNAICAELKLGE